MKARLEITTRCNLACMHCSTAEYRTPQEWTTEEALQVFDDMVHNGIEKVDFLGGEPFIRKDILQLFSYLDKRGIGIIVTTNGLLLDEDTIESLMMLRHLNGIFFSIDGASKEIHDTIRGKNSFKNMISNFKSLIIRKKERKSQFNVGLNFTVNKINASESDAIIVLADRLDLDTVYFGFTAWVGNAKKNKDSLYADPHTEFTALKRAAHKISQVNKIRRLKGKAAIRFSVDSMPSTWKYYLLEKYPLVSSLRGKFQCLAGEGTFLVDASGVMYPCEAAKVHVVSIEKEIGTYEKMALPEHTIEEVKNSGSFQRTVAYIKNREKLYQHVVPCSSCLYRDGCSVCPLYAKAEMTVTRCSEALMRTIK